MSIAAWTPNQPVERMAAGERLAQFRGPEAAAIAHFFRSAGTMNPNAERNGGPKRWFLKVLLLLAAIAIYVAMVYPIARALHHARQQQQPGRKW